MRLAIVMILFALAASFASGGPATDSDGDGVFDVLDFCSADFFAPNPCSFDSDDDGFGNRCDCDLNNDLVCDTLDVPLMQAALLSADPIGDIDCDSQFDSQDVSLYINLLTDATSPGPSGLSCAGTIPCP